jgi:hypothetical protein
MASCASVIAAYSSRFEALLREPFAELAAAAG